ncbi:MAG: hypothetical protein KAX77_05545 [Xanthomonadales bacterium]|nr:hypothetical protein [Xanthomonadales bacterium]
MFGFFRRPAGALHPFVAGLAAAASLLKPLPAEDGAAPGGWLRNHIKSRNRGDGHRGEQIKRRARNRRRNKLATITKRQMRAKARR